MTASIIFCNDNAEFVIVGDDDNDSATKKKLRKLKDAHCREFVRQNRTDKETYNHRFVWHIKNTACDVIKTANTKT